jgi:ATP-dependent DNA helicase DinG
VVPHSVAEYVSRMAGFQRDDAPAQRGHTHCARCGRKLTSETVAVLEGKPYGPDCIRHVDLMGDAEHVTLAEWLTAEPSEPTVNHSALATPVVFTSATLAAPDMSSFMREAGLPYALQMVASSPFDYETNALLYVPSAADAPVPTKGNEYRNWLVEEMERLVKASQGGAFLLFTSYDAMRFASERLRWTFEQRGYPVFVQGQLPKLEIVKRFAAAGNGVLFATKSFWEGVSIDGEALRLVVIDKMPFEAPSPLNAAQEAALTQWAREQGMGDKEAEWYPFENLRVPRMIIDLKQGTGRLIRTQTDWGVIAILDARLRSAQYARRLVLPSLPPAKLTSQLYMVDDFFHSRKAKATTRFKNLTPVEQLAAIATVEEIPF